jgi:hypothetical protein
MIKKISCALLFIGAALPPDFSTCLGWLRLLRLAGGVWGGAGLGTAGTAGVAAVITRRTDGQAGMAAPVGGGGTAWVWTCRG